MSDSPHCCRLSKYRRNLPRDHDEYVYGVDGRSNFDSPVSDTHIGRLFARTRHSLALEADGNRPHHVQWWRCRVATSIPRRGRAIPRRQGEMAGAHYQVSATATSSCSLLNVQELIKYSVWRPINHPVKDNALALCHPSSLDEDDLAVVQYHPSSEHVGSMYKLHYSEKQKWLWLSCQQPDETVLFLQYDSRPGIGPKCR